MTSSLMIRAANLVAARASRLSVARRGATQLLRSDPHLPSLLLLSVTHRHFLLSLLVVPTRKRTALDPRRDSCRDGYRRRTLPASGTS